jgi:hypothetical protein
LADLFGQSFLTERDFTGIVFTDTVMGLGAALEDASAQRVKASASLPCAALAPTVRPGFLL